MTVFESVTGRKQLNRKAFNAFKRIARRFNRGSGLTSKRQVTSSHNPLVAGSSPALQVVLYDVG
ncbi:hypothetical protein DDT46_19330 [Mycobacteroides abscessus]|uniref:Uncharacterized protein n=1 Tax=Mycobacteroides abscessus TaxID=36809 RepID=A0ABD7HQK5_9MYCO|nr:hypothetical protein MYCSP_07905 [Mycobacteroides saopaulense]AWG65736.1 hypothetical protein DDT46_19330 [Mycobacteroides abscessus]PVA78090.1 hypothetical protein DDJ37_05530 [Mycobacteroides abscessus]PVB19552.1 hypothetical protein DDJ40_07175 [Mycobacteroides abscessus]PVB22567.1 hypothetical protein DDJ45_23390 [Mycobacteroides abscessus]